jgi:WD40 repeat protein
MEVLDAKTGVKLEVAPPDQLVPKLHKPRYAAKWKGNAECDIVDSESAKIVAKLDTTLNPLGSASSSAGGERMFSISDNGRLCALASVTGLIRLYNLTRASPYIQKQAPVRSNDKGTLITSYASAISAEVVLPDGSVLTAGDDSYDSSMHATFGYSKPVDLDDDRTPNGDPENGTYLRLCKLDESITHIPVDPQLAGCVMGLYLSADKKTIYADAGSNGLCVIDRATWNFHTVHGFKPSVSPAEYSPFTFTSGDTPGIIRVIVRGEQYYPATVYDYDSAFHLISKRVIIPCHQKLGSLDDVLKLTAVSSDGAMIAAVRVLKGEPRNVVDGAIEIWDTRTSQKLKTLSGPFHDAHEPYKGALDEIEFSPDGKVLAAHDDAGRILLWDVASGQRLGQISDTSSLEDELPVGYGSDKNASSRGYASNMPWYGLFPMAFTPDGKFIAWSKTDGTIYVYSLTTLLPVEQIGKCAAPLRWMQFSPVGHTLLGYLTMSVFDAHGTDHETNDLLAWNFPEPTKP